mmetsp:Transcript_16975/g.31916  ORF Transcript_16975/g.31916 Transcript_16975/m.31916 type:complete len:111 (+) Transcript_16975:379-711(+)
MIPSQWQHDAIFFSNGPISHCRSPPPGMLGTLISFTELISSNKGHSPEFSAIVRLHQFSHLTSTKHNLRFVINCNRRSSKNGHNTFRFDFNMQRMILIHFQRIFRYQSTR